MHAAGLIDKLVAQFDVDRPTALDFLNAVHKRAVADSLWRTSLVALGTTTADTGEYTLPTNIVNLRAIRVTDGEGNTTIYDPASVDEVWSYDAGAGSLDGAVFAETANTSGVAQFSLRPIPDTTGLTITGLQALEPADLTDSSGSSPIIPEDFHMPLLYEGMIAWAYRDPAEARDDMAAAHEQAYLGEIERLKARKSGRVGGGSSVSRMRVAGYDFVV